MSGNKFNVRDIVWAKVRGYPWWPSTIISIEGSLSDPKYNVNFIGENSHATVSKKYIAEYNTNFKEHSRTKDEKLKAAIKIANETKLKTHFGEFDESLEEGQATEQSLKAKKKKITNEIRPTKIKKVEEGLRMPLGLLSLEGLNRKLKEAGIEEEYTVIYVPVRVPKSHTAKSLL